MVCSNDVVPVVMGAPRSDYERAAPPQSFIHVDDFASPRHLADFLRSLAADRTRYNDYFRWQARIFQLGLYHINREAEKRNLFSSMN